MNQMKMFSLRMAWRETRAAWRHFLYFLACIAVGVGGLVAVSLFGVMDALVKWLAATYPTVQIMFFRSLFALPPILLMVWRGAGGRLENALVMLRTRQPGNSAAQSRP